MRRPQRLAILGVLLGLSASSGCIGEFALTRDVYRRNRSIDSKAGREAAFLALCIVPVYEAALLADVLVFNAVELFSGENPLPEHPEDAHP